jgi:hypothetical protein
MQLASLDCKSKHRFFSDGKAGFFKHEKLSFFKVMKSLSGDFILHLQSFEFIPMTLLTLPKYHQRSSFPL